MTSSPSTPQSGASRKVLLVEDDPATAELIRRTLERCFYSVEIASSVQQGLKAICGNGSSDYVAMLLDYTLPDGEPWELADAAKAQIPEVPVVFVTAVSNENVAIEAVRRGFADYVKKSAGFWNELPVVLERVARLSHIKGRLDETSALMRAIVEQSSDLVTVCSADGSLIYISPVCLALLGKRALDLVGSPWTEIVAPEDRHVLLSLHSRLNEAPTQFGEVRCLRGNGMFVWMEARVALLKAAQGVERLMVFTLHDVTVQREHDQQMQASLREKEILLREVYHRVKNNLQVVQSLLKMQGRTLPDGETRAAIETTVQRVYAMAMVHERLYQSSDLAALSLPGYLGDLFADVVASHALQPDQVHLAVDAEEIQLPLDRAVPFGLLANELLSNCLKHAFPDGRRGTIVASIHRIPGAVRLLIQDDGIGLPMNFNLAACNSMGLKLAVSLAHQLGGRLEFSPDGGCRVQADLTRI